MKLYTEGNRTEFNSEAERVLEQIIKLQRGLKGDAFQLSAIFDGKPMGRAEYLAVLSAAVVRLEAIERKREMN